MSNFTCLVVILAAMLAICYGRPSFLDNDQDFNLLKKISQERTILSLRNRQRKILLAFNALKSLYPKKAMHLFSKYRKHRALSRSERRHNTEISRLNDRQNDYGQHDGRAEELRYEDLRRLSDLKRRWVKFYRRNH
ncbi:uncharacterized protein TRIADDRAFT_58903 [Trichoplax adhaerens]|uniref:Uncharacterized protein n=1 Tax=Trichoplax adhaerens TaxID=10228 RepID=B3S3Z9_TRIAD|nr:predicted protein [Trichoplax adhaerens]EDV22368.1 predicted protein [Trichoplax adhaerens]|eukprot:XP_002114912.1 predicted protein [Trichoplax adhaerens]